MNGGVLHGGFKVASEGRTGVCPSPPASQKYNAPPKTESHRVKMPHTRSCVLLVRQRVRPTFKLAVLVFKALHGLAPRYLADDCQLVTDAAPS